MTSPAGDGADDDQDGAGNEPADDSPAPAREPSGGGGRASSVASDGAGWVLGLFLWAGVALPFLQHGPSGVKAWWLAKFFNKAPDGSWLP